MPALIVLLQALIFAVSGPPTSPEYLPVRVAEAEGYFAAEGLAVTVRTTRAESGAAEAVAQGQADLAATTLEAILRFGLRATTSQAPRLGLGVNAAVFTRADRRAPDRDLAGLVRALRKAEQRIRVAEGRDLTGRLPARVVGEPADFEARLAASRGLYLPDGAVSAEQLQQTITIIRTHTPLPQSVKIPRAEDMLLQLKPSAR